MEFTWTDYRKENSFMVESWLDENAVTMTGLDMGWDNYWNAVQADAVNFPGCKDFCMLVSKNEVPVAVICYGCYEGIATVSEIVVVPQHRGKGVGSRILRELVTHTKELLGEQPDIFRAVIYPENLPSQRAFVKAGFVFDSAHEDGTSWNFVCRMD